MDHHHYMLAMQEAHERHEDALYPTEQQLQSMYTEYADNFDPTPEYLYDPPYSLQNYEDWKEDYLWEIDKKHGLVTTLPTIYNPALIDP